jgi:hypothetical protein
MAGGSVEFGDLLPFIAFGVMGLAAVGVLCLVVRTAARVTVREVIGDGLPVLAAPARLIAKRAATAEDLPVHPWQRLRMDYFATFEFASGERREFSVLGSDYGALAEGDTGLLLYEGLRYHGFRRKVQ